MWKNDNFFVGLLASLLLTLLAGALVILLTPWIYGFFSQTTPENKYILLAFIPALFLMRWYMKTLRYSKAGAGAVVVIFASIILYFLLIDNKPFSIFFY
jgi:heme/copper-type cytochrome/quinol oxidase subunit 4